MASPPLLTFNIYAFGIALYYTFDSSYVQSPGVEPMTLALPLNHRKTFNECLINCFTVCACTKIVFLSHIARVIASFSCQPVSRQKTCLVNCHTNDSVSCAGVGLDSELIKQDL